jgi:hypothetical protein
VMSARLQAATLGMLGIKGREELGRESLTSLNALPSC